MVSPASNYKKSTNSPVVTYYTRQPHIQRSFIFHTSSLCFYRGSSSPMVTPFNKYFSCGRGPSCLILPHLSPSSFWHSKTCCAGDHECISVSLVYYILSKRFYSKPENNNENRKSSKCTCNLIVCCIFRSEPEQ